MPLFRILKNINLHLIPCMRLCLGVIKCKGRISKRIILSFLSNNRVTDGGWGMRLCYGIEASQAEGFLSIFVLGVLWSLKKVSSI